MRWRVAVAVCLLLAAALPSVSAAQAALTAQPAQAIQTAQATAPAADLLRCGWFSNPTPGNAWLTDRHGEWLVGVQGGHQAEGDWPEFSAVRWVKTNGHYGYGCACLRVVADAQTQNVLRIVSASSRPLRQCRNDKALKRPLP